MAMNQSIFGRLEGLPLEGLFPLRGDLPHSGLHLSIGPVVHTSLPL